MTTEDTTCLSDIIEDMDTESDPESEDSHHSLQELSKSKLSNPPSQKDKPKKKREDLMFSRMVLPPCRICSAKASGFHYGVNSCESCKVVHCCLDFLNAVDPF